LELGLNRRDFNKTKARIYPGFCFMSFDTLSDLVRSSMHTRPDKVWLFT